jgi:hypothetical protein
MSDKYTLIFEDKNGNAETIEMQHILLVFDRILLNLQRIKKDGLQITLIKNSEYLSEPKNTNFLIQMAEEHSYIGSDRKEEIEKTEKLLPPQEKAEQLVNKLLHTLYDNGGLSFKRILYARAVQCALIAVDEIIEEVVNSADADYLTLRVLYWKQVKKEIENLQDK